MWLLNAALAGTSAIGPFSGELTENFDSLSPTNAAIECTDGSFEENADICASFATIGGIQIRDSLFLGCLLEGRSSPNLAGSNDGPAEVSFYQPVQRFGGYFGTHSGDGDLTIELYDTGGALIGSFTEPLGGSCVWGWRGYEVDSGPGIKSVRVIHSQGDGALIDMDDLVADTQCGVSAPDTDGDGVPDCVDCAASDPTVYPGQTESCDGVDNDCSGTIDDNLRSPPLSAHQHGVCEGALQSCTGGAYVEPDYSSIPHYEPTELTCDGLDNDCDGAVDVALPAPPVGPAFGVCLELLNVCEGADGWTGPPEAEWPALVGYEPTELTCDGLDNDCDGAIDNLLDAPPATNQRGVCEGSVMVCDGSGGWSEPTLTDIPNYAVQEICDHLDNDCDQEVDEDCVDPAGGGIFGCSTAPSSPGWALPRRHR